jgi:inner membrane protein
MPSPIAHMAAGYVIYRTYNIRRGWSDPKSPERVPLAMVAALGLSLLPDVDSVAGFLMGDFGRFHNDWTHSLIVGLGVSVVVGSLALFKKSAVKKEWFLLTLLCYGLHVVMDFFTIGRGVMALWPFSTERYASPIKVFYGLHWSDGWLSIRHLWTLITELCFVVVLNAIVYLWTRLWSSMQIKRTHAAQ